MAFVPTSATQLPFVKSTATTVGRGLWKQQVLPLGSVEHPSKGKIEFSEDILKELVSTFDGGAMDQVAYCLVDSSNRHNDDPERFRGEIRRLELGDDGLYAVIDPSPRGRDLLSENPRQPVSARITVPETGDFAGRPVLAHVAATPDPVARGMRPGEWVDASAQVDELVDLSAQEFVGPSGGPITTSTVSKDAPATTGTEALELSAEEKTLFGKLVEKLGFSKEDGKVDPKPEAKKDDTPEVTDDALEKWLAECPVEGVTVETPEKEAVAATLSEDDRKSIDMANETANTMAAKAGTTELSNRLSQFIRDGVPPALVEATREKLIGESDEQKKLAIDFAHDRKPPAIEIAFAALEAAKGTIEFTETGTSVVVDEDKQKAARELAEKAAERYV